MRRRSWPRRAARPNAGAASAGDGTTRARHQIRSLRTSPRSSSAHLILLRFKPGGEYVAKDMWERAALPMADAGRFWTAAFIHGECLTVTGQNHRRRNLKDVRVQSLAAR